MFKCLNEGRELLIYKSFSFYLEEIVILGKYAIAIYYLLKHLYLPSSWFKAAYSDN